MRDEFIDKIELLENQARSDEEFNRYFFELVSMAAMATEHEWLIPRLEHIIDHFTKLKEDIFKILPLYHTLLKSLKSIGGYHKALDVWEKIEEDVKKCDPNTRVYFYDIIGGVYKEIQKYGLATHYYELAVRAFIVNGLENNMLLASLLNNLGTVYALMGEHDEAIKMFVMALKEGPDNNDIKRSILINFAASLNDVGDFEKSIELIYSIVIDESIADHPEALLRVSTTLIDALISARHPSAEIKLAIKMAVQGFVAVVQDSEDPIIRGTLCHDHYNTVGIVASYLYETQENMKGLECIETGKIVYGNEKRVFQEVERMGFDSWIREFSSKKLMLNSAYIHFQTIDDGILVYVVIFNSGTPILQVIHLGNEVRTQFLALMAENWNYYNKFIMSDGYTDRKAWNDSLEKLISFVDISIMNDVRLFLDGHEVDRVYVSPHGKFSNFPFHALNDFMSAGYRIAYVPSLAILSIIGDAYSLDGKIGLLNSDDQSLEYVGKDIKYVADVAVSSGYKLNYYNANDLIEGLCGSNLLHFSGHGKFDHAQVGRSYLLVDKQKVELSHIINMPQNLSNALVNISACSGAESLLWNASSALNLAGSFLSVGAVSVLACSWIVSDFGAYLFNRKYYESLIAENNDPYTSYQVALDELKSSGGSFELPIHWAPFKYHGIIYAQ